MRESHPLVLPLAAVVFGIATGALLEYSLPWQFFPLTGGVLFVAGRWGSRFWFDLCLSFFWFAAGMSLFALQVPSVSQEEARYLATLRESAGFEGVVLSRPAALPDGCRFTMRVENVWLPEGGKSLELPVVVTVASGTVPWVTGDRVRVRGTLRVPEKLGLPGEFEYARYLRYRGIRATVWVTHGNQVVLMRAAVEQPLRRALDRLARANEELVRTVLPDPSRHTILNALITGNQLEIPPRLAAAYSRAGVVHILSISGFHVAVVSATITLVLVWLGLRCEWLALRCDLRRVALLAVIPIMVLYLLYTGAAPATLRAVVMMALVVLALWAERSSDLLDTLIAAAFVLLLANPALLFDLSFQLSFLSLWGIVVLTPYVDTLLQGRFSGWSRTVMLAAAASLAALLATAAPVLAAFHQVSLVGVVSNIVIIPLLGYGAVLLGGTGVVLGAFSATLAAVPIEMAGWLVALANRCIYAVADIPVLTSYAVGTAELLYTVALLSIISFCSGTRRRVAALLLCTLCLVGYRYWPATDEGQLRISFLSVGQAESTVVQAPDGTVMLIDGGGYLRDTGRDFGERYLVPALHALGVRRIDRMVLTHPHPDHIGGLPAVAERFAVGEFWSVAGPHAGPEYQRLRAALEHRQTRMRYFSGRTVEQVAGLEVRLIAPQTVGDTVGNEESLVLRLGYGDFSALLMGDAGIQTEQRLSDIDRIPVTLLKVGHHGSRSATGEPFLAAVQPSLAVISVGRGNRFGLPSPEVMQRLEQRRIALWRTDQVGTIRVVTDGRRFTAERHPAVR